ncbi:MAG: right-handed parallel beta-helix repeat-containing protein, partial [Trueperaceae bacterium]
PDQPTTLTRATQIAQPGDTVYLRGGTYPIQTRFDRSGTPNQPITWTSYPGEWAILDGSDQTPVTSQHRVWIAASWNVFANFEVRHGPQEGIQLYQAHDNLLTNLVTHHHHYSGILVMHSDRNRFEHLTTHDNYDLHNPRGLIGDDADGISISSGDRNTLYRVIAYGNSDDGIDAWRSTNTTIDSSISYDNGRGTHGNGNGIKAGGNAEANHTIIRNSIAFGNKANGFDDNDGRHITYYNNTAYANGGFAFGDTATLRNNLAHANPIGIWGTNHHHNSWNLTITNPNFQSTDPNHPDFLTLTTTSPAINAGTPVGLTYTGTAPDLGALEHQTHLTQLLGQPLTTTPNTTTIASNGF